MEDKVLKCIGCGEEFVFTVAEQQFHMDKGYTNVPKRCTECRAKRFTTYGSRAKVHEAECAICRAKTKISFEPKSGRPIYCEVCLSKIRSV